MEKRGKMTDAEGCEVSASPLSSSSPDLQTIYIAPGSAPKAKESHSS